MRNGWRVCDADTHVNPAAEVLDRYVDPDFRPRLPELEPYRIPIVSAVDGPTPSPMHNYRVGTKFYRRVLGEPAPRESFTGRETRWMGTKKPRQGIQDDQAQNRIADMDDEGTDVHFLIPTSWLSFVGVDDPTIEIAMIRAYHRHMADFCGQFPGRLTSMIVASTRNVDEAVRQIREWGKAKWAVAVMPLLAKDIPADHPSLEPIWREAQEYDLPIANHSFTWNPPYYPGYQDLWDNIFLGRLAAHPWGAMRFVGSFVGGGIFDRYPRLRMGVLECGFGWLPFWARRMDEQAVYVGGTAPLKHTPSEYLTGGRFFCSIEHHEGEDMFNTVTHFLSDDVLMYASDYPHSECQFPNSVDNILAWSSLKAETKKKLLWDNAARFFRLS
ncbi:MAG TPA: amidohydrolase family protein [Stellaceae bacterium]|nr:amidohydrolase family protein [Stellaceae bacterium]